MIRRILSAIVGGAVFVALGLAGGIWLAIMMGALLLLGTLEFWRLCRGSALRFRLLVPAATGLLLIVAITAATDGAAASPHTPESFLAVALILLVLAGGTREVIAGQIQGALTATALTVFAGVYISFPLAYMIMLRALPGSDGIFYFFLLTVVTWANDSAAYFIGSAIGRHRLAPTISPHKSVEGSIGGLAFSILAGALYALAWSRNPWLPMALGLAIGLAGQVGDLFESLCKRDIGVKDSGSFLPGHGGVLDRFDSLFFAAPVLYYLVAYLKVS